MNIPRGDNQFQNIPRCVAMFLKSQFWDVKGRQKSVDGKDDFKMIMSKILQSLLSLKQYTGDCNHSKDTVTT